MTIGGTSGEHIIAMANIDSHIPLPPSSKYPMPLAQMEVNDSHAVPYFDGSQALYYALMQKVQEFQRQNKDKKFKTRRSHKDAQGIYREFRVWRVA